MHALTLTDFLSAILRGMPVRLRPDDAESRDPLAQAATAWERDPRSDQHTLEDVYRLQLDGQIRSLLRR